MRTLEEVIAEIEAFYNPKIAARQVAYDAYLQLTHDRDAKIRRAQEWFAKRAEADRLLVELGKGPEV